MSKLANSLSGASSPSVEDLSAQIEVLKNDLATLTQTLSDYGVAKTEEVARNAKVKAEKLRVAGRDTAIDAQLHAEEFVRTQPATAMGIAAGLGFLVGLFTARR